MSSYQNVSDFVETADERLAVKRIEVIAVCQGFAETRHRLYGNWNVAGGNLFSGDRGSRGRRFLSGGRRLRCWRRRRGRHRCKNFFA